MKGFSFVELILVVALILILAGTTSAFYSNFLTRNAVANTTDQILGQLRKAQMYAMMGKSNGNWGVNFSSQTITLYEGSSYPGNATFETISVNNNISVTGFSDINFSKISGKPSTPVPVTITISGNNESKTITVNELGVASK